MPILQILADGGPLYTETDLRSTIVEPYNTLSAVIFLVMAVYWYGRLRGSFSKFIFLSTSLVLLAIGGLGGVIYHAFRYSSFFLFMDWLPIMILCVMASLYFLYKVTGKWKVVAGYFIILSLFDRLIWEFIPEFDGNLRANVNYAIIGTGLLIPTLLLLLKNSFRFWYLVLASFLAFSTALFFRISDQWGFLPMGTHFLWHTFGALAGHFMLLYIHKLNVYELGIKSN
jgi:hypothetical protein